MRLYYSSTTSSPHRRLPKHYVPANTSVRGAKPSANTLQSTVEVSVIDCVTAACVKGYRVDVENSLVLQENPTELTATLTSESCAHSEDDTECLSAGCFIEVEEMAEARSDPPSPFPLLDDLSTSSLSSALSNTSSWTDLYNENPVSATANCALEEANGGQNRLPVGRRLADSSQTPLPSSLSDTVLYYCDDHIGESKRVESQKPAYEPSVSALSAPPVDSHGETGPCESSRCTNDGEQWVHFSNPFETRRDEATMWQTEECSQRKVDSESGQEHGISPSVKQRKPMLGELLQERYIASVLSKASSRQGACTHWDTPDMIPKANTQQPLLRPIWESSATAGAPRRLQQRPPSLDSQVQTPFSPGSLRIAAGTSLTQKLGAYPLVLKQLRLENGLVIRALDELDETLLTYEQILCLRPFVLSAVEQATLQYQMRFEPNSHQDVDSVSSLDHTVQRMESILFMKKLPGFLEAVGKEASQIRKTCSQVLESPVLPLLLCGALNLFREFEPTGVNTLFRGGTNPRLRISSLYKLSRRTGKSQESRLQKIVYHVLKCNPGLSDQILSDLQSLIDFTQDIGRWDDLSDEFSSMSKTLDFITNVALDKAVYKIESAMASEETSFGSECGQLNMHVVMEDEELFLQSIPLGRYALDAKEHLSHMAQEMEDANMAMRDVSCYYLDQGQVVTPFECLVWLGYFWRDVRDLCVCTREESCGSQCSI